MTTEKDNLVLQERGLVAQITDSASLGALMAKEPITLYCGFDPTADSLHIGNLIPLLALKRFQAAGHRPIVLVGGATGMIGDPSFKSEERTLKATDVIAAWADKIRGQLTPFLSFKGDNAAILVNNYDWFSRMNVLDFLRDTGKHFSVNAMISKEFVKQRIHDRESGISFTEFSYSLLQAYDFVALNRSHNCVLQIGGSDQWGNITAGVDLVRRLNQKVVYGLTLPLITKSDGTKFGKTESGTVWLDPKKTSPYRFYQFWLSAEDADVYRFLKLFTFLPLADIAAIASESQMGQSRGQAQLVLAEQMTLLVHGADALLAAKRITENLFSEERLVLTESDFSQLVLDGLPHYRSPSKPCGLIDALVDCGLATSKSQARQFIEAGAVRVNKCVQKDLQYALDDDDFCHGRYSLLSRGKQHHALLVHDK